MKAILKVILATVVISPMFTPSARSAELAEGDPANFNTFKKCTMCHKKEDIGDQVAVWEKGPHAKAFSMLAEPKAKEVAAKPERQREDWSSERGCSPKSAHERRGTIRASSSISNSFPN